MRPIRCRLLVVASTFAASVVAIVGAPQPSVAGEPPAWCEPPNVMVNGRCVVQTRIPRPGDPGDPGEPGRPGRPGRQCSPEAPYAVSISPQDFNVAILTADDYATLRCWGRVCRWFRHTNQEQLPFLFPHAPPDAELQVYFCVDHLGRVDDSAYSLRALRPNELVGEIPPTPASVARDFWLRAQLELPQPTVVASPASGVAAVVAVPTFVSVSNWEDPVPRSHCQSGVCVRIDATPRLTFDPGDDTGEIPCNPGGTLFDPHGAEPRDQAAVSGACAHAYTERTPTAAPWPGKVTVTYVVTWSITGPGPGESGTLDDYVMPPVAVPRPVVELQAPVVGADLG